jgi:protein involved in polysaccharide export with SLBB domain
MAVRKTMRTMLVDCARAARSMTKVTLAAAVMAGSLAACTGQSMPSEQASDVAPSGYTLGSGDNLRIDVFGDESMSGERRIAGDGTLTLPLIGRVEAAGLTTHELKQKLESQLTEYMRDPRVNVQMLTYRPVYIVGEVKKPGSYSYVDGMTVLNAVAIAGGFTYRARQDKFVIERKAKDKRVAADPSTPLIPGDVVTVQERYF